MTPAIWPNKISGNNLIIILSFLPWQEILLFWRIKVPGRGKVKFIK
jgi:hypothetical protein